jgi:hypothetical protein
VLALLGTWRHLAAKVEMFKGRLKAMENYPYELAQNAACQNHTGRLTGLWFLLKTGPRAEYYKKILLCIIYQLNFTVFMYVKRTSRYI